MFRPSSHSSLINSRRNIALSQPSCIPWTAQNCYPCLGHTVTYVLAMICHTCLGHGPSRTTERLARRASAFGNDTFCYASAPAEPVPACTTSLIWGRVFGESTQLREVLPIRGGMRWDGSARAGCTSALGLSEPSSSLAFLGHSGASPHQAWLFLSLC
jgi:hypothetical protein